MDYLLAADFSWLSPASWWAIAQVVIGLGFVIFVHELGHFLVAKACGVKCEKFYVGFDFFDIKLGDRVIIPRSLVKWQWGETEYGVGIVPLGGYVKMFGQVDSPAEMEKEIQRSMIDAEDKAHPPELPSGLVDRSKMDPRSFLAKSVPQRMAIMSAGVVFNLVFAVIFAAIAFRSGVDYDPPTIGSVVSGGPAWEADLANTEPTRIGDRAVEGYFTYTDMAQEIALTGGEPLEIRYLRPGQTEEQTVTLTPRRGLMRRAPDLALIGVGGATTNQLGPDPLLKYNPAEKADPPLKGGDTIVSVNGTEVTDGFTLRQALALHFDRPAHLVVERKTDPKSDSVIEVETTVETNPMRELGMLMEWGPIAAIQSNSPASEAGIRVGDEILTIDGAVPGQIFTVDQYLTRIARDQARSVPVSLLRDGEELTVEVIPRIPRTIPTVSEGQPVAIESLGIAVPVTRILRGTISGSPAEKAGLQSGDEVVVFEYRLTPEQAAYPLYAAYQSNRDTLVNRLRISLGMEPNDQAKINLDAMPHITMSELLYSVQLLPVGTQYGITVRREGEDQTVELTSGVAENYFLASRGVMLNAVQAFYRSYDLGESLKLGLRQTISDSSRIFKFLVKLVTGQISATNLGGPGTIALVATTEASQGTSRLLLFLTLLSANLAIVNFLPIPVLDGGHMVFLAYEGLFRKPVTPAIQERLMIGGLLFLVALMVSVLVLDAVRIASLF